MRCISELWRGPRVRIAANHAFGEGGCHGRNAGEQISRIQEMFICLKPVAALGFESSSETCSDFPCLLRLRRVVGEPDFWSQTVTRPRGYGRFATHRDPSPATLKIVSISLEEFAAFDTCANQWCQLAAVANVELTEKRAHPIFSRPKPSGCLRRWCATVPGDHGS